MESPQGRDCRPFETPPAAAAHILSQGLRAAGPAIGKDVSRETLWRLDVGARRP